MIKKKNIDVIVPIYNQEKFILAFLESASLLPMEKTNIILVNDGSTDRSAEIISDFIAERHLTNFFLLNKENGGVSTARNFGLEIACSDYIWFCDPDDQIIADANSLLTEIENSVIDAFVFSYEIHKVNEEKTRQITRNLFSGTGVDFLINTNSLSHVYDHPASDGTLWDKIYRRESINKLRFNSELICSEDFDFNLDFFKQALNVCCSNFLIYRYNVYPNGTLSTVFNTKVLNDRIYAERKTISFLIKHKKNVRKEIKKHILKNTNLLSINGLGEPFRFYLSEHVLFKEKIYPFTSSKEFIFVFLSFLKLYEPVVTFYRKLKDKKNK
ncbi:TPA: glycosyltransferase [Raoultella ornithinolytica]|nr:glycosyltransferase [Raoultella ornithinolytica]